MLVPNLLRFLSIYILRACKRQQSMICYAVYQNDIKPGNQAGLVLESVRG